jgi:catechol 2,3-dioxygenase-like lactoylglutathione lyase family enzyme
MDTPPIHPGVRIGHVHLKVADLERALAFYRDVLGFELTQRFGPQAAFLSAGGYHPRPPAPPGSITSPFSTPRAPCSPTPSAV